MPIASCPACSTALRVPEGSAAAVRCPKCRTVFTPAGASSPPAPLPPAPPPPAATPPSRTGFGSGVRPGPAAGSGERPPAKPPAPPKPPVVVAPPRSAVRPKPPPPPEPEFEVVDAAPTPGQPFNFDDPPARRPKKAALLDDADDEPPRKAQLIDDDGDDRPRRRRRDDEDDDRPRGRRGRGRGRYDDEDDDDDYYDAPGRRNPYRPAALGSLLVAISLWIYLGVFGTFALVVLVAWSGGIPPEPLFVMAGIAGLGNLVLAGVGLGFLLAGPKKARGLTIAATVLAGVQLVMMAVLAIEISDGLRVLAGLGVGSGGLVLLPFATLIPAVDLVLPYLFASSKFRGEGAGPGWQGIVAILGGGCEIARLILVTLALGAQGRAAKDYTAADRARVGVTTVAWVCGGAVLLTLVVYLMVDKGEMQRSARHLLGAAGLLIFVGYSLMVLFPALTAHAARAGLLRKARKTDKADRDRDW